MQMLAIISDSTEGGIADYADRLAEELGSTARYYKAGNGYFGKAAFYIKSFFLAFGLKRSGAKADIQCMVWPAAIPFLLLCKALGVRTALEAHDDPFNTRQKYRPVWIRKLIFGLSDEVVAHSKYCEGLLKEAGVEAVKIRYIPYTIPGKIEKTGPKGGGPFTVIFFGYVRKYKGIPAFVKALEDAHGINGLIVGPILESGEEIKNLIKNSTAKERITLVDRLVRIPDAAEFFKMADAVLLPYEEVTQSSVPFVAYAHARPVIATDVGAMSEVVKDGETGILVAKGDAAAIAGAIKKLSNDRVLCRELGENGYRLVTEGEFSWRNVASLYSRMGEIA